MVSRIAGEIDTYVLELGTDGRLLALQLEELIGGVDAERELIIRDYMPTGRRGRPLEAVLAELAAIESTNLVDLGARGPRPAHRHRRDPRRPAGTARLPPAGRASPACPAPSSKA